MVTNYRKYPVERMNVNINMAKTGALIKDAVKASGYTIREIMEITGITTPQTIYKWFRGESIPSVETQIVLCKLFGFQITELLVIDGEFNLSEKKYSIKEVHDMILEKLKDNGLEPQERIHDGVIDFTFKNGTIIHIHETGKKDSLRMYLRLYEYAERIMKAS